MAGIGLLLSHPFTREPALKPVMPVKIFFAAGQRSGDGEKVVEFALPRLNLWKERVR